MAYDVRRAEPYSAYPDFDFDIPVYDEGDCMARYLVRMEEMRQSVRIIRQCLDKLPDGPVLAKVPKILRTKEDGMVYGAVEAPKGELGYFIVATPKGTNPYRCHVRPPSSDAKSPAVSVPASSARSSQVSKSAGVAGPARSISASAGSVAP